ncbi:hypothetical protein GRF29_19g2522371 [Pseudopithomyces chartarum]|uniref:Protein kinase domain-containing protein n=1 Tax=Pseudopithomyces chartarum TaxID=1892770 RepID=A0AAN6M6J8_9PLEO|nr:hypothetical protein GRF29_19g2522371 [Pseudopithomyces chartarum]
MSINWAQRKVEGKSFIERFTRKRFIHDGSDGSVYQWENKTTGELVAVKDSKPSRAHKNSNEIIRYLNVPAHENIIGFLGYLGVRDWTPAGPALIFEYCEYGDAYEYRHYMVRQEARVPEISIWKFMRDVSLGLDWIHNHCEHSYVLGDLKPENVLVFPEQDWDKQAPPLLPTFKICDFGRMEISDTVNKFNGTVEFGPPMAERNMVQTCKADVFSLGSTIQWLAFGVFPQMSNEEFIEYAKDKHARLITLSELRDNRREQWRVFIPPKYRPLNASMEEQREIWGLKYPQPPFSNLLNGWYKKLCEEDPAIRIGSDVLAEFFVPVADLEIERLKAARSLAAATGENQEAETIIVDEEDDVLTRGLGGIAL